MQRIFLKFWISIRISLIIAYLLLILVISVCAQQTGKEEVSIQSLGLPIQLKEGMSLIVKVLPVKNDSVLADSKKNLIKRGPEIILSFKNTGNDSITMNFFASDNPKFSSIKLIRSDYTIITPVAMKVSTYDDMGYRTVYTPGGIGLEGDCSDSWPFSIQADGKHAGLMSWICIKPGEEKSITFMFKPGVDLKNTSIELVCELCPQGKIIINMEQGKTGDQGPISGNQATNNPEISIKDIKNLNLSYSKFTDKRDGKTYKTVKIGNQVWMDENLNYDAGVGSWVYNNDTTNARIYGRLYNWETARNVCPSGWHLPSDNEWTTIITYLGDESVVGDKLKEAGTAHWYSKIDPITNATNESGFSALPGGMRWDNGYFSYIGFEADFWSSTEETSSMAWRWSLTASRKNIGHYSLIKDACISVRCVRD